MTRLPPQIDPDGDARGAATSQAQTESLRFTMRNDSSALQSHAPSVGNPIPSRLHTFIVTLLAAFVVGMTIYALQPLPVASGQAANNAEDTTTVEVAQHPAKPRATAKRVTRSQLRQYGAIALGLAVFSLIPSRKQPAPPPRLTPPMVAEATGLTVLGSLFANAGRQHPLASRLSARLVRGVVSTSELILCAAFMLTLATCLLHSKLWSLVLYHPLNGYLAAVAQAAEIVRGWLPATFTLP
jgi:hypothetical protein